MDTISVLIFTLIVGWVASILAHSIPREINPLKLQISPNKRRVLIIYILTLVTILPLSYKLGISREFFVVGGVFGLFIAMSVIDYDYKEVPDSLNLLAFYLALFSYSFFDSIVDGLIMMGAFVLLRFSVSYIIKKEAMGEADIMIAGTMGAVLGWKLSIIAFVLSAFIALPFSIYQRQRGEEELPFVPFLFAGLFVAVIFDTLLLQLWQMLYS